MNNKSFLNGLIYGLSFTESIIKDISASCNPIMVWFKDGSYLTFAINRGISPIDGRFTVILKDDEECNLYDIALRWLKDDQIKIVKQLGYDFEYGEIRITLDDLYKITDSLGEIDYQVTKKEWHKIFEKKYKSE